MKKTKQDYLNQLAQIAFGIDDLLDQQNQRIMALNKMVALSREGKKDTPEFRLLQQQARQSEAIDFGNYMADLRAVVKNLRKFKN